MHYRIDPVHSKLFISTLDNMLFMTVLFKALMLSSMKISIQSPAKLVTGYKYPCVMWLSQAKW